MRERTDMTIQIEGLSRQQVLIANKLWSLDSIEEVQDYMNNLPKRARGQAQVVFELIVAAQLDQYMDTDLANEVIDSVK
jgi:hypothetical protein